MSEPALLLSRENGVLVVAMNRPAQKDAINPEMLCRLADAWGRRPVILAGAAALLAACLAAPLSPRVFPLAAALFLLGLGWNFCYVAGSALLSDQLRPSERARTQGFNDTLIGIASAAGALASGFVFGAAGYAAVGLMSGAAALVPLVMALRPAPERAPAGANVTSA